MPNFTITLGVPIEAIKQEKKSIQSKNKAIKLSHSQMMYVYSNIDTGRASWESFRSWGCTLKGFHGTLCFCPHHSVFSPKASRHGLT
jgi:hypothetical protein